MTDLIMTATMTNRTGDCCTSGHGVGQKLLYLKDYIKKISIEILIGTLKSSQLWPTKVESHCCIFFRGGGGVNTDEVCLSLKMLYLFYITHLSDSHNIGLTMVRLTMWSRFCDILTLENEQNLL